MATPPPPAPSPAPTPVNRLRRAEGKARAAALQDALEQLAGYPDLGDQLPAVGAALAANVGDNNVVVSNTACRVIVKLAEHLGEAVAEAADPLCKPLAELLGSLKVRRQPARARAAGATGAHACGSIRPGSSLLVHLPPCSRRRAITPRVRRSRSWRPSAPAASWRRC